MDIQIIDNSLLEKLHVKAKACDRLRQNFDLRTTPEDGSQRMLNVLEPGTQVPIHRHPQSTETVVCLEGCFDEIFYKELPTVDTGGITHNGEVVLDNSQFVEVVRYRICPREGKYGIQVPKMAWHTIEVHEPSTMLEAKDGKWRPAK